MLYGPDGRPLKERERVGFMAGMPTLRDTRPVQCRFFDADNRAIGQVLLPPRREFDPPRTITYQGKNFIEGDGTGFYGENEFAEVRIL